MMKTMRISVLLSIVVGLGGCGGKSKTEATTKPAATETTTDTDGEMKGVGTAAGQVCCESFGYGAQMVQCCEAYAWTTAEACTVAPGFVGGGKQVVPDDKCAAPE